MSSTDDSAQSDLTVDDLTEDEQAELAALEAEPRGWVDQRKFGVLLLITGVLGLLAALMLAIEKLAYAENPDHVGTCSINPLVTCGDALGSWQGSLLGFSNAYLGIIGFTVVLVLAVLAIARVELPRWFWWGLTVGGAAAFALVVFLIATSLLVLGKLCPYCMVVWVATIPIAVYAPAFAFGAGRQIGRAPWWIRNRVVIVVVLYVTIIALILMRFARELSLLFSVG